MLLRRHRVLAAATSIAHPLFNFDHHENHSGNAADAQPQHEWYLLDDSLL